MSDWSSDVCSADLSVAAGRGRVPEPPPTAAIEIQGLYRDFAVMAAAIERRSRYLRDFAHAMSHEFKTPLSGIRGAIELLEDHDATMRSEEHTSELQSLMRISYAVYCLKKTTNTPITTNHIPHKKKRKTTYLTINLPHSNNR